MRSDAQRQADKRYNQKRKGVNVILQCIVKKEKAERFRDWCQKNGTTVNAEFRKVIDEKLKGEKEMYKFFNGCEWERVSEDFLRGVELEGLEEVFYECGAIRCVYKSGKVVYYEDCHGTWGFPCEFR